MSGADASASDQKFQNYTSLIHFMPRELVRHVGTPFFTLMFSEFLAKQLQLRKPSELTYKEMPIIISLATDGPEQTLVDTAEERRALLQSTKASFRSAIAKVSLH